MEEPRLESCPPMLSIRHFLMAHYLFRVILCNYLASLTYMLWSFFHTHGFLSQIINRHPEQLPSIYLVSYLFCYS